ncbi:MAG TPA: hypothetical protein VG248_00905 [Caulobacteraceae bacterium]|nr:hypothetical protein [Caulobacteraceae bacterium]
MAGSTLAVAAAALASLAGCAQTPDTLSGTYANPDHGPPRVVAPVSARQAAKGPPPAPSCPLEVTAIVDGRHVRDALGSVSGRTVRAPADQEAWLRSVIFGLGSRGFALSQAGPGAPVSGALSARFTLQNAWVSSVASNKVADVIWHVDATRDGTSVISKDYRGASNRMNWSSGDDELQGIVNRAFAQALDAMAVDLREQCPK